jgi:Ser/Thr protein kinase RdoA (MazF antagonist)
MRNVDERIAADAVAEWLGERATLEPLVAMNSSAWLVTAEAERFVLKISAAEQEPGLRVAAWLEERGQRTGAPIRMSVHGDRLAALLRYAEGRQLSTSDRDVELLGETLGRVHSLLAGAPVPDGLDHWPWGFVDPTVIDEADLRAAATQAIDAAQEFAPTLTHGILHGDPASEAFLASEGDVALIDWGAASHGPLLYDVASAWFYSNESVVASYGRTAPIGMDELAVTNVFLAYRWAVQAWYFSDRIRRRDLTGLVDSTENDKGLSDARRALVGQ